MIDLHTHTTASDGTDSPFALINKALSAGITTLAITDHDTTSGWNEAVQALRPPMSLALGAEISTLTTDGISVHMLGLLFDGEDVEMQKMLAEFAERDRWILDRVRIYPDGRHLVTLRRRIIKPALSLAN